MALPSSGPLSLVDIQTEFGGANPISLSEYYAGGAYVPAGTTGTYGAVPSSGEISIRNFYGTSAAPTITLTGRNVTSFSGGVLSANAGWRASNDSYVYTGVGSGTPTYTQREQWDSIPATVGNYEIYVSYTGDAPSGTFNTWLNLGTTRTWLLTASPGNVLAATLSVQIRDTATSTVRATATINLTADAV